MVATETLEHDLAARGFTNLVRWSRGVDTELFHPREAGVYDLPRPIFLNVGRKQLVTPADIVGKIAGVTRLPAEIVGAIDIHQRHTLADVRDEHVDLVLKKLTGIKVKGVPLAPARVNLDVTDDPVA